MVPLHSASCRLFVGLVPFNKSNSILFLSQFFSRRGMSIFDAEIPEVVRSHRKDHGYLKGLRKELGEIFRRLLGQKLWIKWNKQIFLGTDLLYFLLTTASSFQTLGEEYLNLVLLADSDKNPPTFLRSIVLVGLQICGEYALGKLFSFWEYRGEIKSKEKSKSFKEGNIPVALLTYPLLQAADILLYKATHVPVGEDQAQHMDIADRIARNFNKRYALQYFPVPKRVFANFARVKSLRNPEKKMSKSDPDGKSRIEISDSPEVMRNKVKKAITDFTGAVTYEPEKRAGVANLIDLYSAVSGQSPGEICESSIGLDTGQFKLALADLVIEKFGPISANYSKLRENPEFLQEVLRQGSVKAETIAGKNMTEIKEIMGLL